MEHAIEGSVHAPQPTDDAAVLAAYRKVTGWADEDVLHYASCGACDPDGGDGTYYCPDSPLMKRARTHARTVRLSPEPEERTLPAALRREAERIAARVKALAPLRHGALLNSATPEALARFREAMPAVPARPEIRYASGGVIPRPFKNSGLVDGIVHGTAGGPYCGVCGTPAERDSVDPTDWAGNESTLYGRWTCPNGCDPHDAGQPR
ncbi:hypothetical protein [Actinoallomurus sp. CA-142502]|uniref:hypothetical protein n=1 Tax=Actinoallomurus sp. CA-142502 TaxID=3239885 RepID=UPI003D8D6E1B